MCNKKTEHNNRELSWLSFNERVMQEALDETVPLVQRLRFLGIFSNNQDEFFKVRVASVLKSLRDKITLQDEDISIAEVERLLTGIRQQAVSMHHRFDDVYQLLCEELRKEKINIVNEQMLTDTQKEYVATYFSDEVRSQLVPILLERNTSMSFLQDDRIYLAVRIVGGDVPTEKNTRYSIVEVPNVLNRFVTLPMSDDGTTTIILLEDVIRFNLKKMFFMLRFRTIDAFSFKITRDSEISLGNSYRKRMVEELSKAVQSRVTGKPIRLIYDEMMPEDLQRILIEKLEFKSADSLFPGGRYQHMKDLMNFPMVNPILEEARPKPAIHPDFARSTGLLNVVKRKDVLLFYPYHSFSNFIDFLREAAFNRHVEEIYISVYRVAERSKVMNALINAARNGKKVTAVIELKARFDEKNNIYWSKLLEEAGVNVVHGNKKLKVHAKLALVKFKQGNKQYYYSYIGTGNFNETTSKIYSDIGLFTVHQGIGEDVERIFSFIEKKRVRMNTKSIIVSPERMRDRLTEMIRKEIEFAKQGKLAKIDLKLNALVDSKMIELLYEASKAGVQIRIIARSICCLRPQVDGLSDSIKAISIVDKYLEHARIMFFYNGGDEQCFLMSNDWMGRNLDRRVEAAVPIFDKEVKSTLRDVFEIQWKDNVKARDLSPQLLNRYVRNNSKERVRAQEELHAYFLSKSNF
ncbi:MAG: polyphosphate kinase 1 [Tannerellaceae bacterium]